MIELNEVFAMQAIGRKLLTLSIWTGVAVGALSLAACGGSEEERPCAGVNCDFGTCDSDNGQCVNEDTCRVDSQCVPGYECTNGSCQALDGNECSSDADCEAGVCDIGADEDSGACVNPDSCTENSDCLERTFCDVGPDQEEGTCEPDPCNNKTCQRGVCQRGTDNCVSAESCTEETEVVDCVAGEKCAVTGEDDSGTCAGSDSFCDNFECGDNGVCDFDAGGCTDAATCEGDSDCLEGKFCNEMGQCRPDLCEQGGVTCEGNGVCQPATGQCQNAESCESTEDCINNPPHLCVDGTCTLESTACGDASGDGGCPGNQNCEYDGDDLSASCTEPDTCDTSLDCTGDRQCAGRTCQDPKQCEDDDFEPNNSTDEATNFIEASSDNTLAASVCSGDTDMYTVDTTKLASPDFNGTMLVEVDVPEREHGLGSIDVTVTDPEGNERGSASTGSMGTKSQIEVATDVSVSSRGEYTVEVSAGDDVKTSGVQYELSANATSSETISACQDATPIRPDQRISGTTENAASSGMGSSCTSADNTNPEKVYALEIDDPQEVTFDLTPQLSSSDLSMSLRSRCMQPASERSCVEDGGKGESESMTALLGEGTHYLVVQAPVKEGASGGPFELTIDRVFTACSSKDNYCGEDGSAHICTTDGGRFRQVDCDAGCNPSTGSCIPPEGNSCGDAPSITTDNADQTRQISLNQLTNEYSLDSSDCFSGDNPPSPRTGGPEQTYTVEVPARTTVTADVNYQNEAQGAVYFVKDCGDTDGTCQEIGQDSVEGEDYRETVTYSNLSEETEDGSNSETVYLVVDSGATQSVTTAELQVNYEDVICSPNEFTCSQDGKSQECNNYGNEYREVSDCFAKCGSGGKCRGNTCSLAANVTSEASQSGGVMFTTPVNDLTNDVGGESDSDVCDVTDYDTESRDAVFSVDLSAGEVVTGRVDIINNGSGEMETDPTLTILDSCSDVSNSSCLRGDQGDENPVYASHEATQQETVFLVVDNDDEDLDDTENHEYQIDIQIRSSSCDSSSYSTACGSGGVNYCSDRGGVDIEQTYSCAGGSCTDAMCDTRESDYCFDTENLTSDARQDGGLSRDVNLGNFTHDFGYKDVCGLFDTDTKGPDAAYKLEMNKNEILEASLDQDSSSVDTALYLVEQSNCTDLPEDDCLLSDAGDTSTLTYKAEGSAETVYLVADSDEGTSDTFTLEADLKQQQCQPDSYTVECDGNGDLQYCTDLGLYETYSCNGGCDSSGDPNTSDTCGDPRGGICADARPVSSGDSVSEDFLGLNWLDPVANGNTGSCSFPNATSGAEYIYEVDLTGGEELTASYDGTGGFSGGSSTDSMYLLGDCGDASTCIEAVEDSSFSSGMITYEATDGAETVYVVVDEESQTSSGFYTYGFDLDITISTP
jgi:hypothetical protein